MNGIYLAFLFFLIMTTTSLTRATIAAMMTVLVIAFYTWFLPTKYARVFGYSCIVLYALVLVVRYPSNDAYLTTLALVFFTVFLTEIFGRFKVNLERAALTDHLCGVWNRRGFEILLDQEINSASRTHEPLALIYLDLDGFKALNDQKGHVEGDIVLRRVSEGLLSGVRSCDNVARLGGDEFVLLLPRTTLEGAERIGERLREEVTVFEWSFGVAEYLSGESIIEFVRRSDDEMMAQKRARNRRDGRNGPVSA
jgi:diguanylate cyclase (GGDEF)-like protein